MAKRGEVAFCTKQISDKGNVVIREIGIENTSS